MSETGYQVTHIDRIPEPAGAKEPGERDWHTIRIHFGIQSFGVNAYKATEPGAIVGEHDEVDTKHEELFFVASGNATFTVDGETVEAPAGTFVYVPDPASIRSAAAHETGTTVVCLGGTPGEAFSVSEWEQEYDPASAH
ncbi:MAG TPA: cupin domain-containing protein [Gaiellaceae bacterium]|jgi:mannose-6-phosphate isomerase-like protein (cupin superfamily)